MSDHVETTDQAKEASQKPNDRLERAPDAIVSVQFADCFYFVIGAYVKP